MLTSDPIYYSNAILLNECGRRVPRRRVKNYLYTKLLSEWGGGNITNEYSFNLVINLLISSQIIRNLVEKINTLVYERESAPLNLSFQQAVKRREIYDDMSNPYPMGPWREPGIISSCFRIMVNKSAVCPVGSCPEYFTKKNFSSTKTSRFGILDNKIKPKLNIHILKSTKLLY